MHVYTFWICGCISVFFLLHLCVCQLMGAFVFITCSFVCVPLLATAEAPSQGKDEHSD